MKEIFSVSEMRKAEQNEMENGRSSLDLIQDAARGLFSAYPYRNALIVCGSGNNASDGYALALLFEEKKIPCKILRLSESSSTDGEVLLSRCRERRIPVEIYCESFSFSEYEEIVDCIFGIGFHGEMRPELQKIIANINQSGAKIISADINSGLCADNGLMSEGGAIKSDLTVAIGAYKYGHFLNDAKDCIGSLKLVDIGLNLSGCRRFLTEESDFSGMIPKRKQNSNKGNFGTVGILGGCSEYTGAAKLANLSCSALRAGCGISRLIIPKSLFASVSPYLLESTLFGIPDEDGKMLFDEKILAKAVEKLSALAVGMGWGFSSAYEDILTFLLEKTELPLLIDADGLNTLARMDPKTISQRHAPVILTPHPKEFERLSGIPVAEILRHPVEFAEQYAGETGTVLLLKGSCTLITDGKTTCFSPYGCAGMATAGSGDVLSGLLVGLLGFLSPGLMTVSLGAFLAGRAGELAEQKKNAVSMIASDTVSEIPTAIDNILKS